MHNGELYCIHQNHYLMPNYCDRQSVAFHKSPQTGQISDVARHKVRTHGARFKYACFEPGYAVARGLCVSHGGGKWCKYHECTHEHRVRSHEKVIYAAPKEAKIYSVASRLAICHGRGRRCSIPDCNKEVDQDGLCTAGA